MADPAEDPVERVVVELHDDALDRAECRVVLAAALTLFSPEVEVAIVLAGVDVPEQAHADRVLDACRASLPAGAVLPTIDLLGHADSADVPALVRVRAGRDPFDAVRAVVRLSALAAARRDPAGAAPEPPAAATASGAAHPVRAAVSARIRERDAARRPGRRPLVVAVVQVQSYWPALASVCEALQADEAVDLEVVAVESEHDVRATSTADFVRARGYAPRDVGWFRAHVEDRGGPLALVLLDHPYDGMRPEPARATTLAEAGVRMAYSPYTTNALGAGEHLDRQHHDPRMQYDLPLHRLAWRTAVRSQAQRALHARWCATGDDGVRVTGTPKHDRVVRAAAAGAAALEGNAVLQAAEGRPVVLWNPHFSFGPGGWSTFDVHVHDVLDWFAAHDDVLLLLRPHFRIWRDLRLGNGGRPHPIEQRVRQAARRGRGVLVDDDPDYLPAFLASDAMVSDLSSLIVEYVPLRKPVLYLHREDGPGFNEDAAWFAQLEVATTWPQVAAFLEQVRLRADAGAGRRELLLREHLGHLDGRVGERVAAMLVADLAAEGVGAGTPVAGAA